MVFPAPDDYRLLDRKAAEEALRQSEQRFHGLVDAITDYAVFMLDRDGLVATWNVGAHRNDVIVTSSVDEALAAVKRVDPHVLVSDIGMPGQDGYSLMKHVRALEPPRALSAIALTAYTRAEDRAKALAAGFDTHLGKPVNPDDLIVAVRGVTLITPSASSGTHAFSSSPEASSPLQPSATQKSAILASQPVRVSTRTAYGPIMRESQRFCRIQKSRAQPAFAG